MGDDKEVILHLADGSHFYLKVPGDEKLTSIWARIRNEGGVYTELGNYILAQGIVRISE